MSNIIGIDVSKASLDCAYLLDVDQQRAKRKGCQNEVRCFASLVDWAEARSGLPVQALAFIIEPTHIYHEQLVQFLYNTGATVYLVNPGKVRKFAEGIGILSKNDLIDADLLGALSMLKFVLQVRRSYNLTRRRGFFYVQNHCHRTSSARFRSFGTRSEQLQGLHQRNTSQ